MGAALISLKVSGDGDRAALHEAIWEDVQEFIRMYTASSANNGVYEYLSEAVEDARDRDLWGADGERLEWTFRDYAGCAARSAWVWEHWFRLALAADRDRFTRLADKHGLSLGDEPSPLADLLAGDERYVELRGDLWSVSEDGLHGDDRFVDVTELTDRERKQYATARERCLCGPCTKLRPEPRFRAAMLNMLSGENAPSAAWYLARTAEPSPELLVALVRAGGEMHDLVPEVERCARRVPGAWQTLVSLLPDLRGGALGLALYALAEVARGDDDRRTLLRELDASLGGSDEAAVAAAELAGRIGGGVPGLPGRLAAVLDRDVSDRLRHSAVLGLVNLHLPPRPAPDPEIRVRLEREAERDTEAGKLATWALTMY
ncbi:hypothetical protein [Rhizohabitans arisaemae]|uniref:hypothetical protein n=1 Tax=Rhizohabitans arisaemae TaxID=2720610 RepID=UPI0024B0B9C7|nr:hypothetical protein [Rhizohabitans arisaemae]